MAKNRNSAKVSVMNTNGSSKRNPSTNSSSTSTSSSPLTEVATFAGGCFWGMEEILRKIPGVLHTEVGYTGGTTESPTYEEVKAGGTGHAEAVKITFDSDVLSFEELLDFFFRMHNPTTRNRQGNDFGDQYRSAIFYHSQAQREASERFIEHVNRSRKFPDKVVTELTEAGPFWKAEDYHQRYLEKNPGGYTCHFLRD